MAQDQLEEIKNRINIVDLISEHIPLKKAGRNFKALCPFHSEKTPSFIVSPERQIWHCFGACSEGGDIFKFLMKIENMDFGEALRILAKKAGVKLRRYQPSEAEKQKGLLYEINHLASEFYHYLLLNHAVGKKALDYILGRGITKASLQLFKLGFAPDSWDSLQKFLVGKKGYRIEDLEKAGLVIKRDTQNAKRDTRYPPVGRAGAKRDTSHVSRLTSHPGYYDRFRNRLMFPLKDHRGNVCGFAGRVLDPKQKEAKYVNTPETVIYQKSDLLYGLAENKEAIKKADQVILVEGELDAISSYQAGAKSIVAIKGSALTSNQVRLLSRFTKNIVLALDQDIAGDQAARRGIEVAEAGEMSIRVVQLKEGKDPDEVAQKNPQLWRKLVKRAVPIYDYFLDSAFSRFEAETAEGKRQIGQELVPTLAKISNDIVRAHYVKKLAERLGVSEEVVASEIVKAESEALEARDESARLSASQRGESVRQESGKWEVGGRPTRREILEEYLLGLCFQSGHWQELRQRKVLRLLQTPRFKHLLEVLAKYFKRYKTVDSQRLVKMLPAELKDFFDRLYLLNLDSLVSEEEKFRREIKEVLIQLEELSLKEKLKAISQEIETLEKEEETSAASQKKLDSLHQKFRDLSGKLS